MPKAKEISKAARQHLRKVKKLRGISAFCKRASINERTFHRLIEDGISEEQVVNRVEAAATSEGTVPQGTTPEMVETIVGAGYGIAPETLRLKNSNRVNAEAKQVSMLLMRESGMSKAAIARHYDYCDHTSVTPVLKTIEGRLEVETELQERVKRIRAKIQQAA